MKRQRIIAGNIYHVLTRGVDKRNIFLDDEDRFRFVHDLFEFNDTDPLPNTTYNFGKHKVSARLNIGVAEKKKPRKFLVKILVFTLMPNHYHLMVKPLFDDALFKFMKRLNMGYAKYFNGKYDRKGALFEGRYKSILLKDNSHFIHLPYYIHCNVLDLEMPEWRNRKLKNFKKAVKILDSYRWSSHMDYSGKHNFPSVTQREFLLEYFNGENGYKKSLRQWLGSMDLNSFQQIVLEE